MRQDPKHLFKVYKKGCDQKDNFWSLYERAYNLVLPNRNLYNEPQAGQRRNFQNYSSIGSQTVDRFVNHMQSSLTPPFKRWVELQAGERLPAEIRDPLNQIYSQSTRTGFEILNASNFDVAVTENFYDMSVGTGCMIMYDGDDNDPVMFETVHPKDVVIVEDVYGRPHYVFRKRKVEAVQIKEIWPTIKLNTELQRKIKSDPLCEVCLIEVVYRYKNLWYYEVLFPDTQERIYEATMSRSCWIITRLGKVPGEPYGRGPVIVALEDLQMYNKAKELQLRSAQLSVFGTYTVVDDGVINPNTIVLSPGMFIPVANNGVNPSIMPLGTAGNFDIQQFMLGELQTDIKTIMMNDRLPPEIGAVRSATEYQLRAGGRQIDMQSYFGRLQHEFVQGIWSNLVTIMYERELMGEIPPELANLDNIIMQARVVSPLAKEQGIVDMQNTIQTWQAAIALAGQENVNASYKVEDLPKILARDSGMSLDLLRSDEERDQILAAAREQAAMQQAMQMEAMSGTQ